MEIERAVLATTEVPLSKGHSLITTTELARTLSCSSGAARWPVDQTVVTPGGFECVWLCGCEWGVHDKENIALSKTTLVK